MIWATILTAASGSWFEFLVNNRVITEFVPEATGETLAMTGLSALITVIFGLPLGLFLYVTSRTGLRPSPTVNAVVGFIVNVGRSLPFVILLISIIPFTRWVIGTTVGWQAAVVPLSVAAIPFFARLVEASVREVPSGKIDAARVMGSTTGQIVRTVLFRESLPSLVAQTTVTVITLISYSAMAGIVGGGGLGALAINYGYNRYQADVMIITVVIIFVIVQLVQLIGDAIARWVDHR